MGIQESYQILPREEVCKKKECCQQPDEQYFYIPEGEPEEETEEE